MKYKYKYCSNCGELFDKKSETLYHCPKCDFRIFVNPKPAVGVILYNSKSQILLVKRSYNPGKGKWGIVGGFINPGEDAKESLSREINEEIGVDIKQFEIFGSYSGCYLYKGINYKTVDIIYTAKISDEQRIRLSDESLEFKFFNIKEVPLNKLAPDNAKRALAELIYLKPQL